MNGDLETQAIWGLIILTGSCFFFWIGAIISEWIERKQEDQLRRRRRRSL